MIDPNIAHALDPPGYAVFASLANRYCHDILNVQGNAQLGYELTARYLKRLPETPFLDAEKAEEAASIAQELVNGCRQTTEEIREFLHFPPEDTATDHQKRWQPFDVTAWEAFLAGLNAYATPRLERLDTMRSQVAALVRELHADAEGFDDLEAALVNILQELDAAQEASEHFKAYLVAENLVYDPDKNRWGLA